MPNCFTLQRKSDPSTNVRFADIDDELRTAFSQPPNASAYLWHWYDIIGLRLALGHSFDRIITELEDPDLRNVAIYLNTHFTSNAWVERKMY
jgi:hypothetical protein